MAVASQRDPWFDNLRAVAIVFVVIGHWGVFRGARPGVANAASDVIYSFHMPLFVILSGRFMKIREDPIDTFRRSYGQLLLPFMLSTLIDIAWMSFVANGTRLISFSEIRYGLWYLVSLAIWREWATLLGRSKWLDVAVYLGSLVGALGVGVSPIAFGLQRTLAFFPLFLFGMVVLPKIEGRLRNAGAARWGAVGLLVGAGLVLVWNFRAINYGWFQHADPYVSFHVSATTGALWRFGILVMGTVLSLAVIMLVPTARLGWVSDVGRYTLYPYLLHLPVARAIQHDLRPRFDNAWWLDAVVVLAVVPFVVLATRRPVRRLFEWWVEPVNFVERRRA